MFKIKVLKMAKLLNQYKKQQLNKKKTKKRFCLNSYKKVKSKKTKKLKNNSKANENQVK